NDKGFGNSGIQYRSRDFGNFVAGGYQADFEAGKTYSGILYEERMDGILAQRGQKTVVKTVDGKTKIEVTGSLGDSKEIQSHIKENDWNDYVVIAKGNHLQHFINGVQTIDVIDEREGKGAKEGVLALQLHAGEPMTVQFKNIRIQDLSGKKSAGTDLKFFQGNWLVAEYINKGEAADADERKKAHVKIEGEKYVLQNSGDGDEGTFKLNPDANPKTIDAVNKDGTEVHGIYELGDDTIRVCYATEGDRRPTEFSSPANSDRILAVYRRSH
ncbi:MAG: Trehalose utilization, partial [Verrucomicrobiales bacterium]|nr:Trehalose utilization [Verrucomicrobiales bacterium]